MRSRLRIWVVRRAAAGIVAGMVASVPGESTAGSGAPGPAGQGERPVHEAAVTLTACAGRGDPACQAALGFLYETGYGVPCDYEKAFELMLRAAKSGFIPAQRSVGLSYFIGRGVEKDEKQAAHWLDRAMGGGDDEAILLYYHLFEMEESSLGC